MKSLDCARVTKLLNENKLSLRQKLDFLNMCDGQVRDEVHASLVSDSDEYSGGTHDGKYS